SAVGVEVIVGMTDAVGVGISVLVGGTVGVGIWVTVAVNVVLAVGLGAEAGGRESSSPQPAAASRSTLITHTPYFCIPIPLELRLRWLAHLRCSVKATKRTRARCSTRKKYFMVESARTAYSRATRGDGDETCGHHPGGGARAGRCGDIRSRR